ncbi:MAG: HIT domain-containing protein [Candidatus Sungiibacteriota bacterium]
MKKPFVNLQNASSRPDGKYKNIIQKIRQDGVCPFCPQYLAQYHQKPIIKTGRFWILTDNMYPYPGAKDHLLLIHKKHIETVADISAQAWSELLKLAQAEIKKHRIRGGTFYLRFGDTAYTGASVTHLHANLISPDIRRKNRTPIFTRVG